MKTRWSAPHLFIYVTAFLETLGAGLGAPVLPSLLEQITGKAVAQAGLSYGLLISIYAIALVLTSKIVGRLSDAYGRRPVILLALAGTAIDYLVAANAQSVWVLLIARFIAGALGGTLVVCNAYLVDVTPPEQRAVRFGVLKGVLAAGMTLGPMLGGVLGARDVRAPFWVACAVAALGALYGALFLPESLKKEERRAFSLKGAYPFTIPRGSGVSVSFGVLATLLLFEFGSTVAMPITVLYTQLRFGWTPGDLGVYLSIGGLLAIAGQAGLTRLLVPRLGERAAVVLGLSVFVLTLGLTGLTQSAWQLNAILPIAQFGFVGIPALMALISRYATSRAQGELAGLLVAVSTGAQILSPLLGTWLFAEFSTRGGALFIPGLPYFVGAAIVAGSLLAAATSGLLTATPVAQEAVPTAIAQVPTAAQPTGHVEVQAAE